MADQPQPQQVQLRIDESKMSTTYSNIIRTHTMADEVVLDFGINLPAQGPDNQPALQFNVGSRVVMNWVAAKRHAISLGQAIRQYEERNGEIQIQAPAQQQQQGDGPQLAD
ncbi:MAG: DUF3467 domain-containing protein [Planctomycetota bacterium]